MKFSVLNLLNSPISLTGCEDQKLRIYPPPPPKKTALLKSSVNQNEFCQFILLKISLSRVFYFIFLYFIALLCYI